MTRLGLLIAIGFEARLALPGHVGCILMQHPDGELKSLWTTLRDRICSFFEGVTIEPALLHGDLWSGNAGEDEEGPGKWNKHPCASLFDVSDSGLTHIIYDHACT